MADALETKPSFDLNDIELDEFPIVIDPASIHQYLDSGACALFQIINIKNFLCLLANFQYIYIYI